MKDAFRILLFALILTGSLIAAVTGGNLAAQNHGSGGSEAEPTIEELEEIVLLKLKEAFKAIKNKMDFLVTSLGGPDSKSEEARLQLQTLGPSRLEDGRPVAEHLVDALLEANSNRMRERLRQVLQHLGPVLRKNKARVIPPILEAAKKADHRLPALTDVLIALRATGVLSDLEPLLEHENPMVRTSILKLVGFTGNLESGPKVLSALDSPDPEVKLAAVEALKNLRYTRGSENLHPLVASTDARLSRAAIETLAYLSAKESIPVLLDVLLKTKESKDSTKIHTLLTALGTIGAATKVSVQARVEKALRGYLTSRKEPLVRAAGYALTKLGVAGAEVERALTRHMRDQLAKDPRDFVTRLDLARTLKNLAAYSGSKPLYKKAIKEYKTVLEDKRRVGFPGFLSSAYIDIAGCHACIGQFKWAARYLDKIPKNSIPLPKVLCNRNDFDVMRKDSQYQRFFKQHR